MGTEVKVIHKMQAIKAPKPKPISKILNNTSRFIY